MRKVHWLNIVSDYSLPVLFHSKMEIDLIVSSQTEIKYDKLQIKSLPW